MDRRVEKIGNQNYFALDFKYKNNGAAINLLASNKLFNFYQNFSSSIIQNVIEIEGQKMVFEPTYHVKDFLLEKGEEKTYTAYFLVEDRGKYKNVLLFSINSYLDDYKKEFNNGKLYYKLIDLGDIYD